MNWKNKVKELIDDPHIFSNLETYVNLVLENNKLMNLTGFNDEQIWIDGIYQSIFLLDKNIEIRDVDYKLLDIGAGAGFPSIPFLIYKKNSFELTIIESNKKRINFLEIVKSKLNLNINLINKRAEDVNEREIFDYVTARAVTSFKNLVEISSHLGKVNSKYFFLKSQNYINELNEAKEILRNLKIENVNINKYNLNDNKQHYCISYYKKYKTPLEYPRKWSQICK